MNGLNILPTSCSTYVQPHGFHIQGGPEPGHPGDPSSRPKDAARCHSHPDLSRKTMVKLGATFPGNQRTMYYIYI